MLHLIYWKIRKILLNAVFYLKKNYYKISTRFGLEKNVLSAQRYVILEVPKQTVINLLLFAVTLWLDKLLGVKIESPSIDKTLISDILIAMVGIAGVFLGLYCSYIATVFSSKYVNVPQEISNLFRDDFINSKSIKAITNYIIYSIIMLISNLFYSNLGVVSVLVNMIMAIYMVVSYVYIGKRILGMSNTYFVAENTYRSFHREFKKISKHKLFVQDGNFQNHIKKVACKNIETLKIINTYNLNGVEIKAPSLFNFMYNNLIVLYSYIDIKNHIPYDSLWFVSSEYKKWYKATDSEIRIALNNGTFLRNTEATDNFWFEKEILKINDLGFAELINKKEYDLVRKYIGCLEPLLSASVDSFNTKFWVEYIQTIQNQVSDILLNNKSEKTEELAMCETVLVAYLQFAIDMRKLINSFDLSQILEQSVQKNGYKKSKYPKLYNTAIIRNLYVGIAAEENIEHKKITPDWYVKQYISKQIYSEIVQFCESIEIIDKNIIRFAKELCDGKKHVAATFAYTKYIEWYHKIHIILETLEQLLIQTKSYHKEIPNVVWEDYDFESFAQSLNNTYTYALTEWSKSAMIFALKHWDNYDEFPDMLGSCYNNICNFLIQSLSNNDFNSFEKTYPSLWGIVTLYQELSRKELLKIKEPFKQPAIMAILCNPILDFGNISGYAYMWGEISGDERWKNLITNSFSKTLESYKDKKEETCEQISNCFSVSGSLGPVIYNRAELHHAWKMIIEKAFLQSGCIEWELKGFCEVIKTDCLWLKKLIGTRSDLGLTMSDGFEVFGVLVLNEHLPPDKKFTTKFGWEKDI